MDADPRRDAAPPGAEDVPAVPWRRLGSRPVYRNPFLSVREDTVVAPSGHTVRYGVVRTGSAVGMLPFLDPRTVLLVRQHRYLTGDYTWEMPTGGVDAGEPIETAAQRELAEEAGYAAGRLVPLTVFQTSKSILEETAHLYLATDLRPQHRPADHTEEITRHVVAFEDAVAMTVGGVIVDAMTMLAVLLADRLRAEGRLEAVLRGEEPAVRGGRDPAGAQADPRSS